MRDTETAIQEQADDRAESLKRREERERQRKAKLQTIAEEQLAEPTQIGDMMPSSSASAIQPIIQSYETQTTQNLIGTLGPKGKTKGSQASAASTELQLARAPPIETSFEHQELNIPEK